MLVSLATFFCTICCGDQFLEPYGRIHIIYVLSTAFLVIPGLVLLAMYCRYMDSVQDYSYFGPMKIIGYAVEYSAFHNYGMPQVGWGFEWACPFYPTKWCEDTVVIMECEEYEEANAGADHARSVEAATNCVRNKYNISYWEDVVGFPDAEYDETVSPDEDPNWPFGEFYGDCSSCTAMERDALQDKADNADTFKRLGGGLAIAGAAVYVVTCILYYGCTALF